MTSKCQKMRREIHPFRRHLPWKSPVETKQIVGAQNFAKLMPITKLDRNVLVQLREGNLKGPDDVYQTGGGNPSEKTDSKQ